jgi:hypothetical protein
MDELHAKYGGPTWGIDQDVRNSTKSSNGMTLEQVEEVPTLAARIHVFCRGEFGRRRPSERALNSVKERPTRAPNR